MTGNLEAYTLWALTSLIFAGLLHALTKPEFANEAAKPLPFWITLFLTAGSFFWLGFYHPWPNLLIWWVFTALLIGSSIVDIKLYIIPDKFSLSGFILGPSFALLLPSQFGTEALTAFGQSLLGAAVGFFGLLGVVELGKIWFGKKTHIFPNTLPFQVTQRQVTLEEDTTPLEEILYRKKDRLIFFCPELTVGGKTYQQCQLSLAQTSYQINQLPQQELGPDPIQGLVEKAIIPREAMGFGDVKLLGTIGAFLGWQGVLFTLFTSSVVGLVIGGTACLLKGKNQPIPYGPYLALAAYLWLVGGEQVWNNLLKQLLQ